jgi:glycosyl transferase family 25
MTAFSLPIQILVISLERSVDRRAKVTQEMTKISMPWSFLDAVDGSSLKSPPLEYKPRKVRWLLGHDLTPNEIGCYLSHKEAWKRCVEKNVPTLVFEDDFVLVSNFQEIVSGLMLNDQAWDFVRLQGLYEVSFDIVSQVAGANLAKNVGDAVGATAYLLKPEIAKRLIEASAEIYEPVDHFLEHQQKHGLEFLAIRPYPVDITRVKSTIDDRNEREPIRGFKKCLRSIARAVDRLASANPWFPKA